ncbi:MAG: hypothetical protein EAX90_10545 [Candidatus Heimdallarchaeota archaeon]|nr:hypothetical protein [Candidatus Heimdallarchaeota archaeon]
MNSEFGTELRVKLHKEEFLSLIKISHREIVYRVKKTHFFAYDGFVFFCNECNDNDFDTVIVGFELSNISFFYEKDRKRN